MSVFIKNSLKSSIILISLIFSSNCLALDQVKFDNYLQGYVQSLFVHSYDLPIDAVNVKNGVIILDEQKLNGSNPEQIIEKVNLATSSLKHVKAVILKRNSSTQSPKITSLHLKKEYVDMAMPNHSLFQPLIADPKWPRFTVAYQYYFKDGILKHAFAPNFGASFPLYRIVNNKTNSEWEVGIQAGLFGIMDIGANPTALINADYFVGVPITYRLEAWSSLARFYHVSSHLGDEYMLTPQGKNTKRINLSYEGIDLLLSYNFDGLRLYGGGGYIVHKEPSYIKPLKVQTGMEYYFHKTYFNGKFRPVFAIDVKSEQQGKWYPGISCKGGVQLENSSLISNKVQFMLEYYSGKSIHGQFFKNTVKQIGVGIQAFL